MHSDFIWPLMMCLPKAKAKAKAEAKEHIPSSHHEGSAGAHETGCA